MASTRLPVNEVHSLYEDPSGDGCKIEFSVSSETVTDDGTQYVSVYARDAKDEGRTAYVALSDLFDFLTGSGLSEHIGPKRDPDASASAKVFGLLKQRDGMPKDARAFMAMMLVMTEAIAQGVNTSIEDAALTIFPTRQAAIEAVGHLIPLKFEEN